MSQSTRTWLITGVSGGLGQALAQAALGRGDAVVGTVRRATQTTEFDQLAPGRAFGVRLDVTDRPEVVAAAVDKALTVAGHIDVLVNNAGYGLAGAVEELTEDEFHRVMATNFFGALAVTRAVLPHMRARGSGHILNISSVAGIRGTGGMALYNASKFALEGLSEGLAQEVAPFGIKVTIVEPGAFRTSFAGRSLDRASAPIDAYERVRVLLDRLAAMDGTQPGDPVLAAAAMIEAVDSPNPPLRLPLGADAVAVLRGKAASIVADVDAWEKVALTTAYDEF